MESTGGLASALFGKTKQVLLGLFFSRPGESFYVREIERLTGTPVGAFRLELNNLAAAGILSRERRGNQVHFSANESCPIYAELKGLVLKTMGAAAAIRSALEALRDRIDVAFIFGSVAEGSEQPDSDVDLLIVGEVRSREVVSALRTAQDKLAREINPIVYPPAEFRAKWADGHHFVNRVVESPILFIVGGEDELAEMGPQRLAQASPDQQG